MSMNTNTIVIKVGGGEGISLEPVCNEIAVMVQNGQRVVLVHGGSHETNVVAEKLGHPPQWIESPGGRTSRRTDRTTIEIFEMVYCGKVNKAVVELLQSLGINAVGLSGLDGRVWEGERKKAIRSIEDGRVRMIRDDLSGKVTTVNASLVTALLDAGYTPALCPPAISVDHEPINVDADRAAAATAVALGAQTLLFLSNIPGLLRDPSDPSTLIETVAADEIGSINERFAKGRMKNKVQAASEAIDAGVTSVVIASANVNNPISSALSGQGTTFQCPQHA